MRNPYFEYEAKLTKKRFFQLCLEFRFLINEVILDAVYTQLFKAFSKRLCVTKIFQFHQKLRGLIFQGKHLLICSMVLSEIIFFNS